MWPVWSAGVFHWNEASQIWWSHVTDLCDPLYSASLWWCRSFPHGVSSSEMQELMSTVRSANTSLTVMDHTTEDPVRHLRILAESSSVRPLQTQLTRKPDTKVKTECKPVNSQTRLTDHHVRLLQVSHTACNSEHVCSPPHVRLNKIIGHKSPLTWDKVSRYKIRAANSKTPFVI